MEDGIPSPSPPESAISSASVREDGVEPPKKTRRTFLTQNACTRCRQKKSKCDGRRPTCGRCTKNGAQCTYDVAQEGLTRMQNLQQMLERKTEDFDRVMLLFTAFRQGTDELATNLLARMRMGETMESLVQGLEISQAATTSEQQDISDSQDSKSMQSWPGSPVDLDGGAWNVWNPRSPYSSASGPSSSYHAYAAPDSQPQVDGESSMQPPSPYFQMENMQLDGIETNEESRRPSRPPQGFAVPRRPSRGGARK